TGEVTNHGRWFHFESVEQSDDGEYQCRVHNEHGETSHSFTVTVEAAPYWVKEPQNLMYAPRENVRLDCQAEGIPTPTITWTMNGQSLSEVDADQRRSVSGGVLKLLDVEVADTAVYQCEAKNKHGSILLNTYINVVELPAQILTADGLQYRVTEGGDVALQCETFGSPQPHVTWYRTNSYYLSPLLSHYHVSLLTDGTLEVVNVSQTYSGVYVCSVEESNISISAHLEVYGKDLVLAGPQTLRAPRGSTALLRCEAFTDPRLKHERQIVWRRDGAKILESAADDKFTVFHNGTLRVTDVRPKDSGVYSCEVITSLDHAQAEGAISVNDAHSLNLTVTLRWTPGFAHNSPITEFIVESREEQHTEEARWRWEELKRVPGDFREVELKLHPFCTYRFRVTAVNDLGRSEASEASDYHDTPPAIPSSSPSNVRSDSSEPGTLVVTWDEMEKRLHNGQGFKYKVWWREAGGHDTRWNSSYVDRPPFSVTGTGTYTPFEIKVQAVNSLGEGPEPEAERGHSGEDVPLEAPGGVDVTVMNSTVRVKWNEAQNVRGLLLGYKVQLQHPSTAPQTRVVEVRGMKTSEEITGLKLYSVYKLSVTAFNSKGEGPRSKPHGFETPEGAPGPPASLMFESPTDTSLVLFWTPPTETNGVLLGYIVQYQQGKSQSDPSTTHIELQSLDSSSYYLVNVRARTAAGDGPAVTRRFATLLDGVPPSNISMYLGDTYFNMSWVPGERDRNHGFHIRYLRKADGETWQDSELVNSTQGFYSLSGLQPGTIYHLQILHQNNTQWERIVQTEGPGTSELRQSGLVHRLISAIILLLLILFILCLISAAKEANTDADEKRSDSQPSICASKLGSDDSLAEYGDSVDIQFNEDGSFIGQYSGRGPPRPATRARGPPLPPPSSLRPPSLPPCPPSCTDPAKHPTALNTQGSARELQ
uniref:Neural cell adhesion molecule L1 n=1 Tax=Neogobius melanostomus TaxID=47308 RepID=A0A8C6U5L5_9GOBI